MGEKKKITIGDPKKFGVVLEKKGLFDYKKFYNVFSSFFKSYKYDFNEKEYTQKVKLRGKEYIIEYEAFRKVTDYIKFYIDIRIEVRRGKTLNIESHKKQKAHIIVRFKAYYEKDYMNKWNIKFFKKIYEDHIIKSLIEAYEKKLYIEANALIDKTKKALSLITK